MRMLKAGALYFALVFGVGFVLGPIRVLWVVPQLGERTAELLEAPIMLIAIALSARWIMQRFATPASFFTKLGMGLIALGLLLSAEFSIVLWLRGLTIEQYITSRDPVSGTVYLLLLGLFATMPLLTKFPEKAIK